ncbi:MAG: hypothetical protein JW889_02880 [Verrucomicrobia bacterium]|nr:hypothetical protein [Verrucomicrobiota bacterium]
MPHDGGFESWQNDEPWDEYRWEAFLREQDELTDRYMQLEELYHGLPDAEERIAREMGWELPAAFDDGADDDACPDGAFDDDDADEQDGCDYERDPLWRWAEDVAVDIHRFLDGAGDGAVSPAIPELLAQSAMIAAKIAGGRSMGFSRDALGGNIANHKRAMGHVLVSLSALDEAERSGAVPKPVASRFRARLIGARERLMGRIVELRQMFLSGRFIDE